jgi:2'-5' RNA ligase
MSSWSVQTALAVVVPNHLSSWIQECRSQHDSAYARWPPHINLLFPFIEESDFAAQVPRLQSAVGVLPKFRIKLHTTGFFKHGPRKWVLILKPEESVLGSLDKLQSAVYKLYPQCSKQRDVGGGKFTPHVTLGQFETQAAMEVKMAELASKPAVEFELDFISMLARTKTDPFELKHKILLGTSSPSGVAAEEPSELQALFSSGSIPIDEKPVNKRQPRGQKKTSQRSQVSLTPNFSETPQPSAIEEGSFYSLFGDESGASSSTTFENVATSSTSSASKRTSLKKKPEGGAIKSSYYKDKPSPLSGGGAIAKLNSPSKPSPTKSSPVGSSKLSPAMSSPVSKYTIAIQPPTAPQFSAFATSMTATPPVVPPLLSSTLSPPAPYSPSVSLDTAKLPAMASRSTSTLATASTFSPSKPPAPIVIASPTKVELKPKTSSYYSGGKKATIGRKTEAAPSDSSFLSDLSYEASSLSISAEFAKPEPAPIVVHKVLATKAKEPSVLPPELVDLGHRVLQWLVTTEAIKRPKTRTKLGNAITKMCTITTPGMTAQEALQELISAGYLTLSGDKVTLLKKTTKDVQRYNLSSSGNYSFSSDREVALDRCINWIQDPDNQPRTKPALLNTLKQLVQIKKAVNPATIIQNLVENGQITALQDEKGAEFLEYHI